ncbi:FHA domain protein [Ceratobasidium sp. AG-Ba]|nr:FHA domain protein [Ceratobasidium sp. AG-Ba]
MAPYQSSPPACPALYLYPLNDTFIPKQIALGGGVRVKIGRQTNAKTVPGERNGFFDSKVLSRQHAEVWEENGKIYIKDVKSSNGTFINGDRLSAESVESEPCELKSEDIVEFGIDIVGEDNKTIIHHKVATRVFVVLTPEDAAAAAREHHAHLQHQQQQMYAQQQQHQQQQAQQAQAIARRQQGPLSGNNAQLGGLGGLGQSQARPGSKGLSFDHILSKLQMELQKSRETGAELSSLTSAMSEIHDTMGGGAVPPPPPQHQLIPPVRPPTQPDPEQSPAGNTAAAQAAMSAMQTQLRETQSSLQAHVDKIHALERLVEEHEAIKREVGTMREMLSRNRSPLPLQLQIEEGEGDLGHGGNMLARRHEAEEEYDDDSDARSVCTVTPDVEENDERHDVGRPKTPEPTGHGLMDDEHHQRATSHIDRSTAALHDQNAMLAARLEALTSQLEQAITVSQGLQTHAARASSTIAALEAKINALEEEQRASRVLGGQLPPAAEPVSVSKSESSESELTQIMKSELMREMERRWDAWRARTEEEREAEKRTLAAALEEVRAVVDGHKRGSERVEKVEARMGTVEDQLAGIDQANTRVDQVHATVEEISALVRDVDSRVGDVDARMVGVEEQARDAQAQVAEMRREGRTRADAVRAISGTGASLGLGHPGESGLRSAGDSSSTLDASSPGVRKRVRKRSSRGSSGEDSSSLASSMTHEGSVSTRATSPSEDECEDEDGDTRRVERTPTKNDVAPASSSGSSTLTGSASDSNAVVAREPGKHGLVAGTSGIKDVVRILLGVWVGVLLTCVVLGCCCASCGMGSGIKPAPVLSAAAVAVVAIGVGAWMMTQRVKD